MKKNRIFIIQPSGNCKEDVVHHVCRTTSRKPLRDIYDQDLYDVLETVTSLEHSKRIARKYGSKRTAVI